MPPFPYSSTYSRIRRLLTTKGRILPFLTVNVTDGGNSHRYAPILPPHVASIPGTMDADERAWDFLPVPPP